MFRIRRSPGLFLVGRSLPGCSKTFILGPFSAERVGKSSLEQRFDGLILLPVKTESVGQILREEFAWLPWLPGWVSPLDFRTNVGLFLSVSSASYLVSSSYFQVTLAFHCRHCWIQLAPGLTQLSRTPICPWLCFNRGNTVPVRVNRGVNSLVQGRCRVPGEGARRSRDGSAVQQVLPQASGNAA